MADITQSQLKKIISYNQKTGLVKWTISPCANIASNSIAGSEFKNHSKISYKRIRINHKNYMMHRIIFLYMTGELPKNQVDHINGDGLDNRWKNLREVTSLENSRNQKIRKTNSSGVMGVSFSKAMKKWHSYITVGGLKKNLGFYYDKWDAICARKSADFIYGFHDNHGKRRVEQ